MSQTPDAPDPSSISDANIASWCMFIGYPRSGHSLLGSLLNAHRHAIIAHELDALKLVAEGVGRRGLVDAVIARDQWFTGEGSEWMGYSYTVDGQWQGRCESLRVIGDKKGGESTRRLAGDAALLGRLRDLLGVPLRVIHVTRHPLDTIATMARRQQIELTQACDFYFWLAGVCAWLEPRFADGELMTLAHEDLIAAPAERLAEAATFVGLDPEPSWVEACATQVFPSARRTRDEAKWTPELLGVIAERSRTFRFLDDYAIEI